jgi:hypothetical protein
MRSQKVKINSQTVISSQDTLPDPPKIAGTREQMNFASLTPGQLDNESKTMTLYVGLFNSKHGRAVTHL